MALPFLKRIIDMPAKVLKREKIHVGIEVNLLQNCYAQHSSTL